MRYKGAINLRQIEPKLNSTFNPKEIEKIINDFQKTLDKKEINEFLFEKSKFERPILAAEQNRIIYIKSIELINELLGEYTVTIPIKNDNEEISNFNGLSEQYPNKGNEEEKENDFYALEDQSNDNKIINIHNIKTEANYDNVKSYENKKLNNNGKKEANDGHLKSEEKEELENKNQIINLETRINTEYEKTKDKEIKKYYVNNEKIKKDMEKALHDNIYLFSSNKKKDNIDIIAISPEITLNVKNFEKFFNFFSKDKFLGDELNITSSEKEISIKLPKWIEKETSFSFYQYIIFIFILRIKFCWSVFKNCNEKYKSINDDNTVINTYKENYLSCIYYTNLLSKEEILEINETILSADFINKHIKEVRSSRKKIKNEADFKSKLNSINIKYISQIETEHIFISPITNKIIEELTKNNYCQKDNNNEIEKLLNNLFLTFSALINGRRFIYQDIRNYILNYFSNFFKYISKHISNYSKITKNNLKELNIYYKQVIEKTKEILNNITKYLNLKPFELLMFGSYENNLNIEGSDIDFILYYDEKLISKNDLSRILYNSFIENKSIGKCTLNEKKSLISILYIYEDNMIKDKYKYLEDIQKRPKYYEERPSILTTINVDIIYTNDIKEYKRKDEINKIIKAKLMEYPIAKQNIYLLKRLFHINFLDKHYFGGISSFGLLNLCIHIIENNMIPFPKLLRSGELAFLFFIKYSKFDFYNKIVAKEEVLKEYSSNTITIRKFYFSYFKDEEDFESGYTPKRKIFEEYLDGFILDKCIQLFQKSYELIKQEYKNVKDNKIKDDGISFVLKLFHLMETENIKEN